VQQIDIMPSVLAYLHYQKPILSFGKNIFDSTNANIAMNYHNGFQLFQDQYLLQMNGTKPTALFDYINDPTLKKNLISVQLQKKDSMENILKAFMQQYHNRLIDDSLTIK
jgi:hypothetical protein